MEREVKWVLFTTAPDQLTAEVWRDLLANEGIPSIIKPGDVMSFLGVSPMPCRILVPENLLAEAKIALERQMEGEDKSHQL